MGADHYELKTFFFDETIRMKIQLVLQIELMNKNSPQIPFLLSADEWILNNLLMDWRMTTLTPERCEIYFADLNPTIGSEISKIRPVV